MQEIGSFQLLDCTIRDGGYVNAWQFDRDLVREVYRSLSKSGVDFVELGFRSPLKDFDPEQYGLWKCSTEDELKRVTSNIKGAKISIMGDFGKISPEDFEPKADSCIDLVRIAVHKTHVFEALDLVEKIQAKGYLGSIQCMGYSCYSESEKKDLLSALSKTSIDYAYFADSYGSMFPFQIKEMFEPLLALGNCKVGYHPHNNIQMSFANTLEALRLGVHIVDTTIYGIGRGAGNLPTEILLSYFQAQGSERFNVIPILNCIERYFLELKKEFPWGYSLPYMISGIFNSHPSYSKNLIGRKEYSMEDVWKAMGGVRDLAPVGYDPQLVEQIIRCGFIGPESRGKNGLSCGAATIPDEYKDKARTFVNRHEGRDFLVLANGPNLLNDKENIEKFIRAKNPVILGANFLSGQFTPHYHAFNNKKRFTSYVGDVSPESALLLGVNFSPEFIADYIGGREYEPLVFLDRFDTDFGIQDGVITSNCRTISVLLIGLAVVMGAKRVFVAGMDGYMNIMDAHKTLFYDEKFDAEEHELNKQRHRENERYLHQIDEYIRKAGGEGIHIITNTSHSAFYSNIHKYIQD